MMMFKHCDLKLLLFNVLCNFALVLLLIISVLASMCLKHLFILRICCKPMFKFLDFGPFGYGKITIILSAHLRRNITYFFFDCTFPILYLRNICSFRFYFTHQSVLRQNQFVLFMLTFILTFYVQTHVCFRCEFLVSDICCCCCFL